MNKKYELTDESINFGNRKLYRIKALKDFNDIKKGDLGGYVESEKNLSQEDNCWIYDNAVVYDDAEISDNAKIHGNAEVFGDAVVYNNVKIYDNAKIYGNARIFGNAIVYDHAKIYGKAEVFEDAVVYNNAKIYDNAKIFDNARIFGNAIINKNYKITGKVINKFDDIIEIKNPEGRLVTAVLRDSEIFYNIGCQNEITEETFKNRIENEDGGIEENPHRKYYYKIIEMVNSYFKNNIKENNYE